MSEDKNIFLNLSKSQEMEERAINAADNTQENSLKNAQVKILVDAIEKKDSKKVAEYLKFNPLPKKLRGKRIGEFAFENFDENVMDVLVQNKIKFIYIDSLSKVAAASGVEAVKYFIENIAKNELNYAQNRSILNVATEKNDIDILNYLIEGYAKFGEINYLTPRDQSTTFSIALYKRNQRLFKNITKFVKYIDDIPNQHGYSFSFKQWLSQGKFSYEDLLFLQDVYEKNPEVKSFLNKHFPISLRSSIVRYKTQYLISNSDDVDNIYNLNIKENTGGIAIKDMIDFSVAMANPAIHEMVNKEKYKQSILNKLQNKYLLMEFISRSSPDEIKKVFKAIPEMRDWRDEDDNNIAHYCLTIHGTQIIATTMYSVDKSLLTENNNKGKSPLSIMPEKVKSKLEAQLINRALFDNKTGKRQIKKRNNQKKRVM